MDPRIAALFNDDILAAARQRYEIPADKIQLLDGFESFIYEFNRPDGEYILRIGHSARRSEALIHAEVDWINYLAAGGAGVARAVLSGNGKLVEAVADGQGGQFLCTAFVKARGRAVRRERMDERFFTSYGRLLGRMHALTRTYHPSNPAWKRYAWDDPENNTPDRQLPESENLIRQKYQAVFEHLRRLPRGPDGYGLIHQDAHTGNLFLDEDGNITLFDFDDCVYGHFIYDIAMVLFYAADEKEPEAFTTRFAPVFLAGYRQENRLDPAWLKELPHFMKLREIDLFAAILFTMGENPAHPWCARYMQDRRGKIAAETPFISYDWESLSQFL